MADYYPAAEEYLETILELEESGVVPLRARIVERLGVSAPAVSETVRRLEREGYLVVGPDRVMHLTPKGRSYGSAIMRRHRLAERLLVDVLQVPWHQVHEEAGRLEHAISDNLEAHLVQLLGDPATCPHGNPIPGSANAVDHGPQQPLRDLEPGTVAVIRRIDEELEARRERMVELEAGGLMPGARLRVDTGEAGGVVLRHLDGTRDGVEVALDGYAAGLVYATVTDPDVQPAAAPRAPQRLAS